MQATAMRSRSLELCLFSSLFLLLRTARNEVVGRSGRGRTNQISRPPGPTIPLRPKTVERMPGGKGRKQKAESRRQKAEGRRQKAEGRMQKQKAAARIQMARLSAS